MKLQKAELAPIAIILVLLAGAWAWTKGFRLSPGTGGTVLPLKQDPQPRNLSDAELAEVKAVAENYLGHLVKRDYQAVYDCFPQTVKKWHTLADLQRDESSMAKAYGQPTGFKFVSYTAYSNLSLERVNLTYFLFNDKSPFIPPRVLTVDKIGDKRWVTTWFSTNFSQRPKTASNKNHK